MPFTYNGIGTWYYGQRHIHTYHGTCQFCGAAGNLSSYDTTLFFVVAFLPVIPLGRKRILEECSYCRRHRVLGLKQWEEAKEADVSEVRRRLRLDPEDAEAAERGMTLANAYQDEALLNEIAERTATMHKADAAFQAFLGDSYGYFARWPQAEQAYRASLNAADNQAVREALAWSLLKQSRPLDARPYLKHVLSQQKEQSAYLIYYLINGYQAEGLHDEAMALIDARDEAFPAQAILKECKNQRKIAMKNRGTQKKISGVSLRESSGMGYRKGKTANIPYVIAALIVFGAISAYLGSAIWIGQSRKVHLVNGTRMPYTVSVAGENYVVGAGMTKAIRVAEGDVEVAFADADLGLPPVRAHIETPFWTRPFASHAFIINPDQTALVVEEETIYSATPQVGMGVPPTIHFGQTFYHVSGMDYEFEPFPQTIQVKGTQTVVKRRVGVEPLASDEIRVELILQRLPEADQVPVCERLLRLDPGDSLVLYMLASRLDAAKMLKILEPRLADVPIRVEWHRVYQSTMEKAEPGTDLRPRYEKLLAATNGNADALYLLGRAEPDLDKSARLMRQAAEANPPSGYAMYGLGYRAWSEGRFPDAVVLLEKAFKVLPNKMIFRHVYRDSLLAAGDYERLLAELRTDLQNADKRVATQIDIARVQALRGQKAEARATMAQAVQGSAPVQQAMLREALESMLCCCENDQDGYLKSNATLASFEGAFLRGKLQDAADLIAVGANTHNAVAFHGLLYLEAKRIGDKDRAAEQWQALLKKLKEGGRDERKYAEGLEQDKLAGDFPWQHLPTDPALKRVVLAVLADRQPGQADAMLQLARKLNYQRDAISLCLRKAVPNLAK